MKDRNEWFEEVERAYSKLKIVERPYAPPHAAVAVEAEDVLCCLGLHPHISASDWLVINLDEVSELIELIRPVPVTGATSDGYHTFDELYHHRAVLFSVIVAMFRGLSWKSLHHHDGTMYDGMFIVGIDTPAGPATYHYDVEPYWDMFPCEVRWERAVTFNEVEFKACPRCGAEPKVEDVRERSLDRPNVMSVTCPSCGMSNSIAWGSLMATPQKEAVAMLADSWNSR